MLFSLAFYLVQEKKEKVLKPFYARIVSPDELKGEGGFKADEKTEGLMPSKRIQSVKTSPTQKKGTHVVTGDSQYRQKAAKGGIEPVTKEGIRKEAGSDKEKTGMDTSQLQQKPRIGSQGTEHDFPVPKTLKEKLFDKDIISKSAKKEREKKKTESTITFDTEEFKYYGYLHRLKEKIEGIWKYPHDAAERGIYGDLYIKFTIKKNGKLGAVELVRTSGHKSLDDAAIKALKDAEPYWPLPDELDKEGLTITGHFIYSIYGIYIR